MKINIHVYLLDARVMCNRISPIVQFFFLSSFLVAAAAFYFELNLSL